MPAGAVGVKEGAIGTTCTNENKLLSQRNVIVSEIVGAPFIPVPRLESAGDTRLHLDGVTISEIAIRFNGLMDRFKGEI